MTVNIEAANAPSANFLSGFSNETLILLCVVVPILCVGFGWFIRRIQNKPKKPQDPLMKARDSLAVKIKSFLSHVEKTKKAVEKAIPYAPLFTSGISGHDTIKELINLSTWDGVFKEEIENLESQIKNSAHNEKIKIFESVYFILINDALEELNLCMPDIYFIHSQISLSASSFEHSRNRFLIEDCENKMKAVVKRLERVHAHGTLVLNVLTETFKEPEKRPGIISLFFKWLYSIFFASRSK